ncbi:unnamed protein product, partial [Meganyctiphanes norvegica]
MTHCKTGILGNHHSKYHSRFLKWDKRNQQISFWFATFGAGFCISSALGLKIKPIASGGKFMNVCDKIRQPDDVTMGYIIEHVLHKKLKVIEELHSHIESMQVINNNTLKHQISLSYSKIKNKMNVLTIEGINKTVDPTRLLSLHCLLYPHVSNCPSLP